MWLSLLFSFATLCFAQTIDTRGWTVVEYNDALVNVDYRALQEMVHAQNELSLSSDATALQSYQARFQGTIDTSIARLQRFPDWKGDGSLRDVLIEGFGWARMVWTGLLPEMIELMQKEQVKNVDLARLETLQHEIDAQSQAMEAKIQSTQQAFGDRFHLQILPPAPPPVVVEFPDFTAPGMPPQGSELSGQVHLSFALRYYNQTLPSQERMLNQVNDFLASTHALSGAALEQARQEAVTALRAEQAKLGDIEAWQGDSSLKDGLIEFSDALVEVMDEDFKEYCALLQKPHTEKNVNRINALGAKANDTLRVSIQAIEVVVAGFQERWHFAAYMKWQEDRAAWQQALKAPE